MKSKGFIFFIIISFIAIALLFYTGKQKAANPKVVANKVVIECAEVIPFDSLSKSQQDKVEYTSYYSGGNWYESTQYNKQDSYFVKVIINNKLLAELAQSETLTIEKLLDHSPYYLYNKYSISWEFFDEDKLSMPPTTKFTGHSIFELTRNGDRDFLIVGPIPEKAYKMQLHTLGDSGRILSHKLLDKNCY